MKKPRVVWIFSHRIQYFVNLLDELYKRSNLEILAIYAHETKFIQDIGFSRNISWDNRQVTSFSEVVLPDSAKRQHGDFWNSRSDYLDKTLSKFQPDLVHLNGYTNAIQIQGWLWSLRNHVPYVIRGDGDTLRVSTWKTYLRQALVRPITVGAAKVTHQGRLNQTFWQANGASEHQLVWVPCVSDSQVFRVQAFADSTERDRFRKEHCITSGELVLVVSGKLEPRKRPADAIAALAKCRHLPVKLWFLGSGELEPELQRQVEQYQLSGHVHWWGFQNQSQIPRILQAADVLLHTSQADPWPYSILEGAISGLALVLSDKIGSYLDWIAEPQAALTFPCGNIDAIASCIETLVKNRELLLRLQNSALVQSSRHTEEIYCQIFEKLTFDLIGKKGTLNSRVDNRN
ncbi:MAG: hypothetical protein C6Y22_17390 [Hapalosiphonaceae cyanobacterium JJU2]|nr:MAG: hypothetical protein C6Y22_17390 [Hapalosiphonaceae cyanobacterium JJU2]